jgi:hypothetical protein
MNVGDKFKIKGGFSTYDPSDFILRRHDTSEIEIEIVQILDEKRRYCMVKDSSGKTFPVVIPKLSNN